MATAGDGLAVTKKEPVAARAAAGADENPVAAREAGVEASEVAVGGAEAVATARDGLAVTIRRNPSRPVRRRVQMRVQWRHWRLQWTQHTPQTTFHSRSKCCIASEIN